MSDNRRSAIVGCLLGTAIGDALGLWCEGISARRQRRFGLPLDRYHLVFGKGMVSDDTEHTCMLAQALLASGGADEPFTRHFTWRLRWWLLGMPAGIGLATLRAIVKLWLGVPPHRSGVFSAGNGPAMRSALLGVCFGDDPQRLRRLVRASTRITHTDPKAEYGALAIAVAAHLATLPENDDLGQRFLGEFRAAVGNEAGAFCDLLDGAVRSAQEKQSTEHYAQTLGLASGVSGYMYHTVPVVVQCWLRHPNDFRTAVTVIIRCGGDTDSTAAILGGIIGAAVGKPGLPNDLLDNLWEWPCSVRWMEALGNRLAEVVESSRPARPLRYFIPGQIARNLCFLVIVLLHGFRRCLPPY